MASIISAGTTSGTALNMAGDTSGVLQLATNGSTTAVTIDTSQNVGIGTTSPGTRTLAVVSATDKSTVGVFSGASYGVRIGTIAAIGGVIEGVDTTGTTSYQPLVIGGSQVQFTTSGTEQARITAAGLLQFNSGYGSAATAYGCRAWVNFNGTGTPAIRASGNVTSITDNNVGSYTINFTTALVDANYSVSGIPRNTQTYAQIQVLAISIAQATAPTTSALAITVTGQNDGASRTAIDSDYVCVSVFR